MKKSFILLATSLLALASCTRNQEIEIPEANLSLFARTESPADTKTVVESGTHVFWEPGDEIAVFMGEKSAKFTTDITASSASATFKGTFGDTAWPEELDLWAVYPFSEEAVFDGETITTVLPSEQIAREGSFGKDMNLSIAHSTSSTLQFYNVGGGFRFSVTEDGIKKVMFEGLSGEIISGKVKIGFEEGLPVVKEVTGGSPFITLLPPVGKETFEKDTWYFIVAIPGTLEGGYKLRFYKDTDYARKVSEKAVQIKRSIFGNIEKADEGIEYEAQTTHFPETEEDFDYSIEWTRTIGETIDKLIADNSDESLDSIVDQIESVEGVSYVTTNMAKSTIMVMQKDSVWINYLLDTEVNHFLSPSTRVKSMAPTRLATPVIGSNQNGKALILAPFQDSFSQSIDSWKQWLASAFSEVKVRTNTSDTPPDERPEIMRFDGDELSQYNFIIITTHGGTGFYAKMKESIWSSPTGDESSWVAEQTVLASCTKYSKQTVNDLKKHHSVEEIAIVHIDDDYYLAMTPKFLKDLEYKDVGVMLQACSSSQIVEEGHDGSMVQAFLKKKAAFVMGYDKKTNEDLSNIVTTDFLYSFCNGGLSVRESYNFWQFSQLYPSMQSAMLYQAHYLGANVPDSALDYSNFKLNEPKEDTPYYIRNWSPILNTPNITDNSVEYSWTCALSPYEYSSRLFKYDNFTGEEAFTFRTEVLYDVYVDDIKISPSDLSEAALKINSVPSPKDHSWYVVARLMKGNTMLASHQSAVGNFTIKEQIPVPPQVETFPASVDAEKAFLSGMVTNRSLEGLETGFYYYKLTAQEEAMQLSESDKLRLVMGGKKVLSAGDYKDYFGIDLTDIEQSSKYLFVAYATDEYNQTGKGEVLSFTTGSPSVHVSSVTLNKTSLELGVGSTETLIATVLPENASNKKVTWSSSDVSKTTVSSVGVVKGIAKGNAVITVTTEDGGKMATCSVTIKEAPSTAVSLIDVSTGNLDFGSVTVGETTRKTITVSSVGEKTLTVTSISCSDGYSVDWSSSSIAPGSSKSLVVSFNPTNAKSYNGSLIIHSDAINGSSKTVTLSGTGVAKPEPRLSVSTGRLDFGNQFKFTQESQNITITNSGTGTLQVTSISKTNNYGDLFQLSGWTSGGSIVAGESKTITVSFQPLEEKYYEETLTIVSSNSVGEKKVTITLCGTGISESENALIQVSSDELAWGDVEIGNRVTKSFSVMNTGTTALNISSIKIVATDNTVNPSYFSITPNSSCTVSPGNTLVFNVSFIPESERGYYAMVSIKSDARNATQGTSTVWLSGAGIKASSSYSVATPEIVDLGLSVKWASFNLGATNTEEYGDYFAWGETEPYYEPGYSQSENPVWKPGKESGYDWPSYRWWSEEYSVVTTYGGETPCLELEDDAAHVLLGGKWRMPTKEEFLELWKKCECEEIRFPNEDFGVKFTGPNGNSIILPSIGYRDEIGIYTYNCTYQTSSIYPENYPMAYFFFFNFDLTHVDSFRRCAGFPIRPVYDEATSNPETKIPEIVDLGLSVKWASFNLGASKPEEQGDFYAWGETEPYYRPGYALSDEPFWRISKEAGYYWPSYKWCEGSETTMTKYCIDSNCGYQGMQDGKTVLDPEDDAAHVKLGGKWRMPTESEQDELMRKCSWAWSSRNGTNGYLVTGPNGNSIFLPVGGLRRDTDLYDVSCGNYWSSSLERGGSESACAIEFYSSNVRWVGYWRSHGLLIRPVYDK